VVAYVAEPIIVREKEDDVGEASGTCSMKQEESQQYQRVR
jgi:hypothetical protein